MPLFNKQPMPSASEDVAEVRLSGPRLQKGSVPCRSEEKHVPSVCFHEKSEHGEHQALRCMFLLGGQYHRHFYPNSLALCLPSRASEADTGAAMRRQKVERTPHRGTPRQQPKASKITGAAREEPSEPACAIKLCENEPTQLGVLKRLARQPNSRTQKRTRAGRRLQSHKETCGNPQRNPCGTHERKRWQSARKPLSPGETLDETSGNRKAPWKLARSWGI